MCHDRLTPQTYANRPMSTKSSTHLENIFLDHRIVSFENPTYLSTDDEPKFANRFFALVREYISVKHLTTTTYQPQTSEQAGRFNSTIVTCLRHYVAKH